MTPEEWWSKQVTNEPMEAPWMSKPADDITALAHAVMDARKDPVMNALLEVDDLARTIAHHQEYSRQAMRNKVANVMQALRKAGWQ